MMSTITRMKVHTLLDNSGHILRVSGDRIKYLSKNLNRYLNFVENIDTFIYICKFKNRYKIEAQYLLIFFNKRIGLFYQKLKSERLYVSCIKLDKKETLR